MDEGFAIADRLFVPHLSVFFERWSLFDAGFDQGQVLLPRTALRVDGLFPLRYALDFLLVANYLARHGGMLLHASAVRDRDQGILFCGPSGAGKSTMAEFWRARDGAQVLNHDVVALRWQGDEGFAVYGTPWWTEDPTLCSPLGAPIKAICFLGHGLENQVRSMSGSEVVMSLVAECVSPVFYDAGLTTAMIELCTQAAETLPVYQLTFRPDPEVVDWIRAL
jgi:hypothetical protein